MKLARHFRIAAMWLVLASALLLRAGMPSGWMPVAGNDGLRIMLCGGDGPIELAVDRALQGEHVRHHALLQPQDGHEGQGKSHRDPCPFGLALGSALDLPPHIEPILPPEAFSATADEWAPIARSVVSRGMRPPVRGPPVPA